MQQEAAGPNILTPPVPSWVLPQSEEERALQPFLQKSKTDLALVKVCRQSPGTALKAMALLPRGSLRFIPNVTASASW